MTRPKVSVFVACSVDGYLARPDGGLDWLEALPQLDGEDYGYAAFLASVDTLVVGRETYETVRGFPDWPWAGKRVVVLSHRPLAGTHHGERRHEGALSPLLDGLGAEGAMQVYLDGGAAIRQGLREGLVDALTLSHIPVVLGAGRRLFGDDLPELRLALREARSFRNGLVQVRYERG